MNASYSFYPRHSNYHKNKVFEVAAHRITRSPEHEWHQNTCDSSKNRELTTEEGREVICVGDNARVKLALASLSMRALSMFKLTFRLWKVSGVKAWSKTVRARGLGKEGRWVWCDSREPLWSEVLDIERGFGLRWCSSSPLTRFCRS